MVVVQSNRCFVFCACQRVAVVLLMHLMCSTVMSVFVSIRKYCLYM